MAKQDRTEDGGSAVTSAKTLAEAAKRASLDRRAQALRDNLKRRKEQERARKAPPKQTG